MLSTTVVSCSPAGIGNDDVLLPPPPPSPMSWLMGIYALFAYMTHPHRQTQFALGKNKGFILFLFTFYFSKNGFAVGITGRPKKMHLQMKDAHCLFTWMDGGALLLLQFFAHILRKPKSISLFYCGIFLSFF